MVQHVDPARSKELSNVVSHLSRLQIEDALGTSVVEPKHVYVVPSDAETFIRNCILHVAAHPILRIPQRPVNEVMQPIIEEWRARAIGAILSTNAFLRQELAAAKTHLTVLIEERDTALEEFRVSSEQVLSSCQSLQMMNDELVGAKEQLQSGNESLQMLNAQLKTRNAELAATNDDLANLVLNIKIPIVMVGEDLTIRRSTPHAQELLNIFPSDVGRRIDEICPNLRECRDLGRIADFVMSSGVARNEEVQANDGTWYLMRVRPYRTSGLHVSGAVFAFQDIGPLKSSLDSTRKYAAALIESARESIVVLDSSLRVITANNSFYKTFHARPEDVEKQFIYRLGSGEWNLPQLKTFLDDILRRHSRIDDYTVRANFPNLGQRTMFLNARRIESNDGKDIILLAIEDLTQLERSERAVRELSHKLLTAEDEQRRQIARDLHDVTGQKIAALKLNIRALSKQQADPGSANVMAESVELAEQITNEIRGFSYVLHPPMLDELGLLAALREYADGVTRRTKLRLTLDVGDEFGRLPSYIELALFRVVQECLTNVLRHSGSPEATIRLQRQADQVVLEIQDSGRGASAASPESEPDIKEGVGIAGMRERVHQLRGTLEIARARTGLTVTARIPLPAKDP